MNRGSNGFGSGGQEPPSSPQPAGCGVSTSLLLVMVVFLVILGLTGPLAEALGLGGAGGVTTPYSEFREQLQAGNVASVRVQGETIEGEFRSPVEEVVGGEAVSYTSFVTYLPAFGDDELMSLLEAQDVEVVTEPSADGSFWPFLLSLAPIALIFLLLWPMMGRMRSQGQGLLSMMQSRARLYERKKERVTFEDVAGAEGAKTELREIIEFLKDPDHFQRLGGEMPTGVLLVGPPGTGKTLLARAVAGEANVPFYSITGSDFMEMFVGVGASRVRDLFRSAKESAPSIVFIDELDSIGRRRGAGLGGGHDEREQTLNQLLSELDGFEPNASVVVMAATNRPDILDPALLRPGRFDRQVTVDLPTLRERVEILQIHARGKPFADDVELESLARGTPGFSGADLKNILNEAALLAARQDKNVIESEDVEAARDKVLLGLERSSLVLTDRELDMLAYHEAGHAVVAAVLPNTDPIHKVTIVPRGRAMGVTQQLPEREKYIYPREYLLDRLAVMMGGRVAEELVFNTATSGAENDLREATQLARRMVLNWGMSERLGSVAFGGDPEHVFLGDEIGRGRDYSEASAREVDEAVMSILDQAYQRARQTLREYREALDRLAGALREHEQMAGREVLDLIQSVSAR